MAQAIAAQASLALAVKLKKIFEKDDKYLTFPSGLGFSYAYLEFMNDPSKTSLSAQEQLNYKGDFARQLNLIPLDKHVFMTESNFLWDEVERVLVESIFAESSLTQKEEDQLSEAIDFLTNDEGTDGTVVLVYSLPVQKYYEYKTIHEEVEKTYLDEKLSVEFAEGPDAEEIQARWKNVRQKQLMKAMDKAMEDWVNLGYKKQVEEKQALRNSLELRKHLNLYRQRYLNDLSISEIVDLNGQGIGFCTTFFSPSDAFDKQLPWPTITLTKSEILGLIAEAPTELRNVYGSDQGNVDLESITLEYNNVVIIRPWFQPEFFESRYWKLPNELVVSTGTQPATGILPAFITSMIVARNIQITRPKEEQPQTLILPLLSQKPIAELNIAKWIVSEQTKIAPEANQPSATLNPQKANLSKNILRSRSSITNMFIQSTNTKQTNFEAKDASSLKARLIYTEKKQKGLTILSPIKRKKQPIPAKIQAHQLTRREMVTESTSFDGVSVLALVCRRLPKSPNPDTTLQWQE